MNSEPYSTLTSLSDVHQVLASQGFAIIQEHQLNEETCNQYQSEVWDALERLFNDELKIDKNNPSTYKNYFEILPLHSMMLQHYGFGQLKCVWDAREKAAPIFAHLWNVNENQLLTSMDGISFHIAPEHFPNERGKWKGNDWFHTDQSYLIHYGTCIQGFWNIEETGINDGCLSVLQGSHLLHNDFYQQFLTTNPTNEIKDNWYKLNDVEKNWYLSKGCIRRNLCIPKGCFVVWDSRLIHCGTESRLPRDIPRNRLVFYVCMLPKFQHHSNGFYCKGATTAQINKRIKTFEDGRMTTHWPYPVKLFPKKPRTYKPMPIVNDIGNARLSEFSDLQKSLLGFNLI